MIKQILPLALLLAGTAALAQPAGPAPSPYVALVDKPTCTRAELVTAADAYVAAQKKGDITGMPLDAKARFVENMSDVAKDKGLWNTALKIDQARSVHDTRRCKSFVEVIVTDAGHPYVIGTRLYLDKGKILRVDSLVTDKGDWLFNATAYLKFSKNENWGELHKYQHTSQEEMIRGANAYLDFFSDKFTSVPWGIPCARLEGGAYSNRDSKPDASCEVGIPPGVCGLYIVNRDYLIDEDTGVINVFCRFGAGGMPDSHTFRYVDGKVHAVHTLTVSLGTGAPSPQADDNGGMVR